MRNTLKKLRLAKFAIVVLALLLTLGLRAEAQEGVDQNTYQISVEIAAGTYEQAISDATQLMNQNGPDQNLLYFRGYAYWLICFFGDARADLSKLQNFTPAAGWPPASEIVQKIDALYAISPKKIEEIKDAGKVLYRVYYDEDTPISKAIRQNLPAAATVCEKIFGEKAYETAVFIFKDVATMDKFTVIRTGAPPGHSAAWACGTEGCLMFSLTAAPGQPALDPNADYFKATFAHENSHSLLRRRLRNIEIPQWFNEGLAMFAGSRTCPGDIKRNDDILTRIFENKAFLTGKELSDRALFYARVDKQVTEQKAPGIYKGASPYQQGFSMVRFFLLKTNDQQRVQFLLRLRESKDFDASFASVFNASMDTFLDAWKSEAAKGLPPPVEPVVKPEAPNKKPSKKP